MTGAWDGMMKQDRSIIEGCLTINDGKEIVRDLMTDV